MLHQVQADLWDNLESGPVVRGQTLQQGAVRVLSASTRRVRADRRCCALLSCCCPGTSMLVVLLFKRKLSRGYFLLLREDFILP